jgi:hypothetical protein
MVAVGYSLSPGGLLFPWHIGVLSGLSYNGVLNNENPIAGSSAGAIAAAAHGAGVKPEVALEATIRMSEESGYMGGARGNLLPLLQKELDFILDDDVHEVLNNREGFVGLAYKELFPFNRAILDTQFDDRDHVIDSVCNSSMFPFFTSNFPCRIARKTKDHEGLILPRIAVDGFFTVDRDRFGCPCFDTMTHARDDLKVDRTVTVSCLPNAVSLNASDEHNQISPLIEDDSVGQMSNLLRLATQCGDRKDYSKLYEDGFQDAERWIKEEEERGYLRLPREIKREMYSKAIASKDLN